MHSIQNDDTSISIISIEKLEKGTIRIIVRIKDHLFKRLSNPYYPVVWNDEEGTFNDCLAMTPEQEKDLEGIFTAFLMKNNTSEKMLTSNIIK